MKARALPLAAVLLASPAFAADFQPEHIVLSSGGLAEITARVPVSGRTVLNLDTPLDQVDDVLKSLVIQGQGITILSVDLPGRQPLSDAFTSLPLKPQDLQNSITLLTALKGVDVEVRRNDRSLRGIVLGVETLTTPEGERSSARLALATEGGTIEHVEIDDATRVTILDPAMQAALIEALKAIATDRATDGRTVAITLDGPAASNATITYVIGAPVWKPAWRVVLPEGEEKAQFQGWAVLENRTGLDWRGVDLTLSSGTPVALTQRLYDSVLIPRPEVPLQVGQRLRPDMDQGVFEEKDMAAAAAAPAMPAPSLLAMAPRGRASSEAAPDLEFGRQVAGGVAVAATETLAAATFHLPEPVDLAVGRSLTLPFFDGQATASRVSIYQPGVSARHPIAAVRVKNDSDVTLPGGIVTVYEAGIGFVGDAEFAGAAPTEERILPYALDAKVNIATDQSSDSAIRSARAADGILVIEYGRVRKTEYRLEGDPNAGRTVLIDHQANDGWDVSADNAKIEGRDGAKVRLDASLEAGESRTVTVTETTVDAQRWGLQDAPDQILLQLVAMGDRIDPALREPLQQLVDLRKQNSDAQRTISQIDDAISRIRSDQDRVRSNLAAVDRNGDLARTYLERLQRQENEMADLEKRRDEAVATADTTRNQMAELIRNLGR